MTEFEILLADSADFTIELLEAQTLSPSSRQRLERLASPLRRRQFLLGRWLMAQAAGVAMTDIEEGLHYPRIATQTGWLASISHSGNHVAVIASRGARCGLDIEYPTRQRDWNTLAARAFSATESAWVAAATPAEQAERFHRIWTLREAAFKAGLLSGVVGTEPVFDPGSAQACASFYWQYQQVDGLHVSAVCAMPFRARLRKVDASLLGLK